VVAHVGPGGAGAARSRRNCAALDAASRFAETRNWFELPHGLLYLDGNSLGPPVRDALGAVTRLLTEQWRVGLARSWNDAGWWDKPIELGRLLAPLLGSASDEVVVCDSISVNLFKVLAAAARLVPGRRAIVVEADAFPSDRYVAASVAALLGLETRLVGPGHDRAALGPEPGLTLERALDGAGVVLLSHVDYRTARRHDLRGLTALVHAYGALAVWDLAHSVGAFPLALDDDSADFAVGCTYKYLNGGPGAPAFVYAARRHLEAVSQPISGWHGHARPFGFLPRYAPHPGVRRFLAGTPPLLAYAALEASLRLWQQVDLVELAAASRSLSELLAALLAEACPGLELVSPPDPAQRGSHLAYRHRRPRTLVEALAARAVVADARQPDLVRLALTPLYLRHVDVFDAAERIAQTVSQLG
jgi:kynureninase